jgi:hypothetical protein
MNRYYVTIPEGRIKYYAPSEQEVKRVFPEATEITPFDDTTHLYYVEQIQDQAEQELGKGRWIINTVFGEMEYQQFYDPDEPDKLLDGCKYKLTKPIGYTFPILWSLSSPKDFYNTYMKIAPPMTTNWTRCNYLEWAKIKKDGHFRKTKVKGDNGWFWVNDKGEVYEVDNQLKEFKNRWKKYKDNPDTVRVEIENYFGKSKFIYFTNNTEYEDWAKHNEDEVVLSVKNALLPNPDLAKNVFRLPWYPIRQSPFTDHQTAVMWLDAMKQDRELMTFAQWNNPYTIDALEAIVKEVRNAV